MLSLMLRMILLFILTTLLKTCRASTPNCCSLNETQLTKLHTNPGCPIGTSVFDELTDLNAKCDQCPEGTCRVNRNCYCPTDFLASDEQKALCEYSFSESWPRSIEKEDTIYRSCVNEPPSITTEENCCSLTAEQLEARVGTSNSCPTGSTSIFSEVKTLAAKCDRCPFGTCRIGLDCYCPKDFLDSEEQQERCRSSFQQKWDESVGLEDRHWRNCVRPTPSQSFTFDNCCLLSPEQLDVRVGTSEVCPQFSTSIFGDVKDLDERCEACPYGTCRVAYRCYCPQDFLNSDEQKEACRESFGEVHPDSLGQTDSLCPSNPVPKELSPAPKPSLKPAEPQKSTPKPSSKPAEPQNSNPTASKAPSELNSDPGSNSTDSSSSNSESSSSTGESNPSQGDSGSTAQIDKEGNDSEEDGLTTAEIVGIVIGSVTGIISALGVVVAWFACCRRSSKGVDMEPYPVEM